VCLVQFEKDQTIAAHDHPGMTGMILCASGSIHTRNFDLVEEKTKALPGGAEEVRCLLRQSAEQTLEANAMTTLTSKARNIHMLKARAVTQLIDIFTPPYNQQRVADSRWFNIDEAPRAGTTDLFEAEVR
jgi:cysteamine dioxygenase